jgi:hypothetical protein
MSRSLTFDAARNVLAYEGDHNLGVDGGHFVNCLIRTIVAADEVNLEKIRREFPELVRAVQVRKERGGVEWLRSFVKAQLDRRDAGLDFESLIDEVAS